MLLKLNPEGLTKEEIMERLQISDQNFSNYLSRYESYIVRSNDKFYYKNPFEDIPEIISNLPIMDILKETAINRIKIKLLTNGQDKNLEELYQEYKKAGGV